MKTYLYGDIKVEIDKNVIYLVTSVARYESSYPDDMEDVSEDLIGAMIHILYKGLEDIPLPQPIKVRKGDNVLLSYSGGYDSTATLLLLPYSTPVYINGIHRPEYGVTQQQIVKDIGAIVINSNFEMMRTEYNKPPGFNWGYGYASLLMPLIDKEGASYITFGCQTSRPITDSARFVDRQKAIENVVIGYGIKLNLFLESIGECIAGKLVEKAGLERDASSCHYTTSSVCNDCIKCFRKQGMLGYSTGINPKVHKKNMKDIENNHFLAEHIYAMKKTYFNAEFKYLKDIDVSFLDRYNDKCLRLLTDDFLYKIIKKNLDYYGIEKQTWKDEMLIEKFYRDVAELDKEPDSCLRRNEGKGRNEGKKEEKPTLSSDIQAECGTKGEK